nr:FecR domain-containing protein [uncultured Albidiferax sp.]
MKVESRDEHALRQETVAWYVRLCSGAATAADQQAWQQWHQQHPDHQRAWQRIAALRASVQRVPSRIALPTLLAAGRNPNNRRHALRSIAVLAGSGVLGYASWRTVACHQATWLADYRTGVGERRSVELADGSLLTLNTDSAADVVFSASQRTLRLWAGELLVETAHSRQRGTAASNARPLVVQTDHGSVRALGTRFSVRQHGEHTSVAVLADAVEIRPLDAARPVLLRAGQQIRFTGQQAATPQPVDDSVAAWDDGSIVASDWRLGDLVAELARYRPGHLACDPAVAALRVSGAFPTANTDTALRVLARSLPVRVRQRTRYWVRVEAL